MKKTISLLLAFCFLFALLPAVGLTASAGGGTTYNLFSCDFEEATDIDNWSFVDNDGEANGWISSVGFFDEEELSTTGHFLMSASYVNAGAESYFGGASGVQNPDNLAVTPEIEIPEGGSATLSFDLFAVDSMYPKEKISVYYFYDGNYYDLFSETLDETATAEAPKTVTVDLIEYVGTKGRVCFRHHESYDQFMVGLDNVSVFWTGEEEDLSDIPSVGVLVNAPVVGAEISTDASVNSEYEGYYIVGVSWSPDDAYFAKDINYNVTVTVEAEPGYCFNEDTFFHINGKAATVLSRSADQAKISYTFPVAEELPVFLEVSYNYEEVNINIGEPVLLEVTCTNLPAAAEDITYQWYAADAPNLWGEALYGANGKTLALNGDVVGTMYFRCQISCNVGGVVISTNPEEFVTVKVNVVSGGRPSMFFDDVTTADWFYGDVEYVYYNGLMNGTSTNTFSPQLSTTRGMIVTILYRLEGSPEVTGTCPFSDVPAGAYYEAPITWAAENEIVNGMGDGTFAPESNITREQLAAIFFRYAKYKGIYDEDDCVMTGGFKDQDKVSPWAYEAMSWAIGVGLIGGSNESDGLYLLPQGNALRCQVAAILHRFCNYFFD